LMWRATTDTGAISYRVSWKATATGVTDSGSQSASGTNAIISGLTSSRAYDFTVQTVRGSSVSTGTKVTWAPADRYVSSTIRMYEKASSNGSGLVLDPAKGGPKNVSVAVSNTDIVQLAMIVNAAGDSVVVGPAFAFPEYKNVDKFDPNVYISRLSYAVSGLNGWFPTQSLDNYINTTQGNLSAFTLPANQSSSQGFIVRTGTAGAYHYARIVVKSVGGRLLQGSGSDRYVEMEVSYQAGANLPYAKRANAVEPAVGYQSHLVN
jgi:hypothetical protein